MNLGKKERIPQELKVNIWLKYATRNNEIRTWSHCFCCKCCIKIPEEVYNYFEKYPDIYGPYLLSRVQNLRSTAYGHIIAETNGGPMTEDNLRLVCHLCNIQMATKNMYMFCKDKEFSVIEDYWDMMDIEPDINWTPLEIIPIIEEYCLGSNKDGQPCHNKHLKYEKFCTVHCGNTNLQQYVL